MTAAQAAEEQLLSLVEDYKDFNTTPIAVLRNPSEADFARQVSRGAPCLFHSSSLVERHEAHKLDNDSRIRPQKFCPALSWTETSLSELTVEDVEVAVTPHGRADALYLVEGHDEPIFLQPATVKMSMAELVEKMSCSQESPVYYLQSQNSNLTSHASLQPILEQEQVPRNIPLAQPILGEPEAINIWLGDERSVTSVHRDPYENLYLVLKGSKTFTLWPPVDELCMDARMVRTGRYELSDNKFRVVMDEAGDSDETAPRIPWVSIDPEMSYEATIEAHPLYAHASPRTVTVNEGQILYLPSGWYHYVKQECGRWEGGRRAPCIAVNYWYDMDYEGEKYAMRQLVGRLVAQVRGKHE